MNHQLAHLSDEQINNLIARYETGEKIADLISEFKIKVRPSGLVGLFPPIIHKELVCSYCEGMNLVTKRQSRNTPSTSCPTCPECGHKTGSQCWCANCRKKENEAKREVRENLHTVIYYEYYERLENIALIPVDKLTLRDALFITSAQRHNVSENLRFIEPFAEGLPLAPTFDLTNEVLKHLSSKGLIIIGGDSPIDAFEFNADQTETTAYYPHKVIWEFLPAVSSENKQAYLTEINKIVKNEWPDLWKADLSEIWSKIIKAECIEYLQYLVRQRGFKLDAIGDKTHAVFDALLKELPPSKVFYLTYLAVRDTTDYVVKNRIHPSHGKNIFIGALQRKAERAKAEKWELRNSRRDRDCPQSVLSSTFFNFFLELGDKAFETASPISVINIPMDAEASSNEVSPLTDERAN